MSDTDRQVLALLAVGMTERAIAGQVGVSPKTVQRHISRLTDLLDAGSRVQAARRGWI